MSTLNTLGLIMVLGLTACSKAEDKAEPAKPSEAAAAAPAAVRTENKAADAAYTAKTLFQNKCVVCHGSVGTGDGPGAAALNPKPRAFADAAWQGSVSDEQIENTILMGGAAVGKSPAMPGNPDLQAKPEVVKELVKIVRGFKKG
jgi:mono/diheme cytochrome c family protein